MELIIYFIMVMIVPPALYLIGMGVYIIIKAIVDVIAFYLYGIKGKQ